MTEHTRKALERMQAANAALTPEQRAERSRKAAQTAKARKAAAAASTVASPGVASPDRPTATTKARVAPEQMRSWDVCLGTEAGVRWVRCDAPGLKRAMRACVKANPGSKARGGVEAGILPAGILGR